MLPTRPLVSVVTPAYNERENLPVLYERLKQVFRACDVEWDWTVVDDHSIDDTFAVLRRLAETDDRVRAVRFARNCGSHTAIACGLRHARGDCAVVLAADLQDPPEAIPALLDRWRQGVQVVWATRHEQGDKGGPRGFSQLYWGLMGRMVDLKTLPAAGADFFLVDRVVLDAFARFSERNASVIHLIAWTGFRQETIECSKQPRLHGQSGWTSWTKIKAVVDSVTAFSYVPIRLMSVAGIVFALTGFGLAILLIVARLFGHVVAGTGYVAIMTVLLLSFGFLMMFMGILGEYVWRTLDEVRRRPAYFIEDVIHPGRRTESAAGGPRHDVGGREAELQDREAIMA
jgi:polyisoprenyl-phosphate glycosyltransferase